MRESFVEDSVVAAAENDGWLVRKVTYLGRRGAPDRWFMKNGKLILIEFKRPGVTKANPQQQREHRRLLDAGFPVFVCNNIADALSVLDIS